MSLELFLSEVSTIPTMATDKDWADKSGLSSPQPSAVLIPQNQADVQVIVRAANRYDIPLTVRAAGTGKTGGAIPLEQGVMVLMDAFNQVIEVDPKNRVIVLEPAVITSSIQDELDPFDLYYPPDPASWNTCTIGGNVAANAGGPRALKYGVTGDYVMGLEGVWGSGECFKVGGKCVKDVAGYDLKSLLIGSEGTLGIITKITLKVIPKPTYHHLVWLGCESVDDATEKLLTITRSALKPAAAEFMMQDCLKAVERVHSMQSPCSDKEAHLLCLFDDIAQDDLIKQLDNLFPDMRDDILHAKDDSTVNYWWELRRHISIALTTQSLSKVSEDITVPPAKIGEYMSYLTDVNKHERPLVVGYGHLGDGNIHVNICNLEESEQDFDHCIQRLIPQVLQKALDLGGTLTGEHGIGLTKKSFMPMMFSTQDLEVMRQLRRVFDPQQILNPDKVLS